MGGYNNSYFSVHCIGNSPSIVTLHLIKWKDERGCPQIFRLVDRVSASWKEFGVILGLGTNQLEKWEAQYRGDANMCWARVIEEWLNGGIGSDYPVTWEGLYTLLKDAQYSVVAEELKIAVDRLFTSSANPDDEEDLFSVDNNSDAVEVAEINVGFADDCMVPIDDLCKFTNLTADYENIWYTLYVAAMEVVNILGKDKLDKIILQLNKASEMLSILSSYSSCVYMFTGESKSKNWA